VKETECGGGRSELGFASATADETESLALLHVFGPVLA
jgi:hypothetical protein